MTDHAPRLLLGPMLRYVSGTQATVWVETDRACVVRLVLARQDDDAAGASAARELTASAPTWSVHGRHYALVIVDGLVPGSVWTYTVDLEGERVWPVPEIESVFGPSRVRALSEEESLRLAFGSCRRAADLGGEGLDRFGTDALVALAYRMRKAEYRFWPDILMLAGDQVYADEIEGDMEERLLAAHPRQGNDMDETRAEVRNFAEYTWLYYDAWSPAPLRWLFSSVPSAMLLDDHDLRDDWNTSLEWREHVTTQPWWRDRVVGALASYWVYQHLGNLSPAELEHDPIYAGVVQAGDDAARTAFLEDVAWRADVEPTSARWSFVREFGAPGHSARLVAVDSRCSRRLTRGNRAMLDDAEQAWLEEQLTEPGARHILLASTLPVLLLPGIHHLEGWDEALVEGAWGSGMARFGEKLRQAVDLEHWSAFRASLTRLLEVFTKMASGPEPPASVVVLSGDVHCSYIANASLPGVDPSTTAVAQITMSPFRNPLHLPIRLANRLFGTRIVPALFHRLARSAGVADVPAHWTVSQGPWFDNGVVTVTIRDGSVTAEVEHGYHRGDRHLLRSTHTEHIRRG